MDYLSRDKKDVIDKLLSLKPREDYVWIATKQDLFTTYRDSCEKKSYFGQYTKDFRDTFYNINCIEGRSPQVFKSKKFLYMGYFEAKETNDKLFIFHDPSHSDNDLRFTGYVFPWRNDTFRSVWSWQDKLPSMSCDPFITYVEPSRKITDEQLIGFSKEECCKICRKANRDWRRHCQNFEEIGLYIKKTLRSMLKQLDEFMKSEDMVDPREEIEKAIKQ